MTVATCLTCAAHALAQVSFFETNGLRHGELVLQRYAPGDAAVVRIAWSPACDILAVELAATTPAGAPGSSRPSSVLQLWHRDNYAWHLKRELRFCPASAGSGSDPGCVVAAGLVGWSWDPRAELRLHVIAAAAAAAADAGGGGSEEALTLDFSLEYATVASTAADAVCGGRRSNSGAIACSSGGRQAVLLTPTALSAVPPPLTFATLTLQPARPWGPVPVEVALAPATPPSSSPSSSALSDWVAVYTASGSLLVARVEYRAPTAGRKPLAAAAGGGVVAAAGDSPCSVHAVASSAAGDTGLADVHECCAADLTTGGVRAWTLRQLTWLRVPSSDDPSAVLACCAHVGGRDRILVIVLDVGRPAPALSPASGPSLVRAAPVRLIVCEGLGDTRPVLLRAGPLPANPLACASFAVQSSAGAVYYCRVDAALLTVSAAPWCELPEAAAALLLIAEPTPAAPAGVLISVGHARGPLRVNGHAILPTTAPCCVAWHAAHGLLLVVTPGPSSTLLYASAADLARIIAASASKSAAAADAGGGGGFGGGWAARGSASPPPSALQVAALGAAAIITNPLAYLASEDAHWSGGGGAGAGSWRRLLERGSRIVRVDVATDAVLLQVGTGRVARRRLVWAALLRLVYLAPCFPSLLPHRCPAETARRSPRAR